MSDQNLNIVFKNTTRFALTLQQKVLSHGEWTDVPPASIGPQQEVKISASGNTYLQGYFMYTTTEFGDDQPLAVMWRYQDDGKPGRLVTASRANFELWPSFCELRVPTADLEIAVNALDRR